MECEHDGAREEEEKSQYANLFELVQTRRRLVLPFDVVGFLERFSRDPVLDHPSYIDRDDSVVFRVELQGRKESE